MKYQKYNRRRKAKVKNESLSFSTLTNGTSNNPLSLCVSAPSLDQQLHGFIHLRDNKIGWLINLGEKILVFIIT
jgi:hypothetical protein